MYKTHIRGSHPLGISDDRFHGLLVVTSRGQSIIIIHAGGKEDFMPNSYIRLWSQELCDLNIRNLAK
jgi:hypothetical protein